MSEYVIALAAVLLACALYALYVAMRKRKSNEHKPGHHAKSHFANGYTFDPNSVCDLTTANGMFVQASSADEAAQICAANQTNFAGSGRPCAGVQLGPTQWEGCLTIQPTAPGLGGVYVMNQ
jgi:hypothetical protein